MAAGVAAAGVLTLATASTGSAAPGQIEPDGGFTPGTGQAVASGYTVNPVFGNLSFGITAGLSLAGHQNTVAQAISKSVDMGVIGMTMAGEGCSGGDPTWAAEDQPQPVMAESHDPKAAGGYDGQEEGLIHKYARAEDAPFAEAITTVAPLGDAAVAEIRGGRMTATSGVVEDGVQEARAVSEIASLEIGGGQIRIGDMRWEAIHRSGTEEEISGSFTFGSLEIGGQKQSLPGDEAERIEELNAVLHELGFEVVMPRVWEAQGIIFVDPLKIGIIPSENRDALLGPLFETTQDFREQLTEFLLEQSCSFATFITVADLAIGSFSGAGSLHLELGGVRATTAHFDMFEFPGLPTLPDLDAAPVLPDTGEAGDFAADIPDAPSLSGDGGGDFGSSTGSFDSGSSGLSDTGSTGAPEATQAESSENEAGDEVAALPTEPIAGLAGARGGWLAGIGGLGLALLLITAEGDRRKMRQALRQIPVEA